MKQYLFSRRALGVGIVIAAFAAMPVQAASADASSCPDPVLTQPFLSFGDSGWYTFVPGETANNFDGSGWVLSGGASVVTTAIAGNVTGSVLDLPPGSTATSPPVCVQTGEPLARMMTQMVGTSAPSNATSFQVSDLNGGNIGGAMPVLGKPSWTLSPPVNILPGNVDGSIQVEFTFKSNAKVGDLEVYNLYIDPRMI